MKRLLFILIALLLASAVFHAQENQNEMPQPPLPPPLEEVAPPAGELPPPPPEFHGEHRADGPQKFFRELQKSNPEEYQRLMKLRMENREEFMKEMSKYMPRPKRDFDKQQFQRDRECWELAKKIRECQDETEKATMTAELEKKLSDMTDDMIKDMQKRIEEMEKRLKAFQENRDDILKKRVQFYLKATPPPEPPKPQE